MNQTMIEEMEMVLKPIITHGGNPNQMLDGLAGISTTALTALFVVFALWTFFLCKLVFLGKPRNVKLKVFGLEVIISASRCEACESKKGPI